MATQTATQTRNVKTLDTVKRALWTYVIGTNVSWIRNIISGNLRPAFVQRMGNEERVLWVRAQEQCRRYLLRCCETVREANGLDCFDVRIGAVSLRALVPSLSERAADAAWRRFMNLETREWYYHTARVL